VEATGSSICCFDISRYRMRQLVWSPALVARPGAGLLGRPLCAGAAASTDGRRQSRSAVSGALLVPWTRTSTGQRSFAAYGLRTWDRLPTALRSPELSLASYKRQLKTLCCSSTRQCWLQLLVSCTVVRRCCDCTVSSAPTINVQTDLISADGGLQTKLLSALLFSLFPLLRNV